MSNLTRNLGVFVVCAVVFSLVGCGKREEPSQPSDESQSVSSPAAQPSDPAYSQQDAPSAPGAPAQPAASTGTPAMPSPDMDFKKMAAEQAAALKAMNQGQEIEPVSAETLKGYLPASLAGMARADAEAQDVDMMGIKVAEARAEYRAAGGSGQLELTIADLGNLSGVMRMGMTAWTMTKVDEQTDTGYEKSVTFGGYKGMEQYDRQAQEGAFHLFVADRFLVKVDGTGTTMEIIKQAMGQIDLKKLAQAAK